MRVYILAHHSSVLSFFRIPLQCMKRKNLLYGDDAEEEEGDWEMTVFCLGFLLS